MKFILKKIYVLIFVCLLFSQEGSVFAEGQWVLLSGEANKYISLERYGLKDIHFPDMNNGWIIGRGYGDELLILHSSNGGKTWHRQSKRGTVSQTVFSHRAVYFVDSKNGWIVGDKGLILNTEDGGERWTEQNSGVEPLNLMGIKIQPELFSVNFIDNNYGWAVGALGTITHTDNGGLMWEQQASETKEIWFFRV